MPVATDQAGACSGKISVKTETGPPTSPLSTGSRKRPLSSGAGTVTTGVTWPSTLGESRIHIGGMGRPRSRFSSVRNYTQMFEKESIL